MAGKRNMDQTAEKARRRSRARGRALRITLIYYLIGSLWIIVSDLLVERLFVERLGMVEASLLKGLFYVVVTAGLIYTLICDALKSQSDAQAELRESERSKDVLMENLPGVAYRCSYDPLWTVQFISAGCYDLTGYRPEALVGNRDLSFIDLIAPLYREPIWNRWNEVLKEKGKFKGEYEIVTASGEVKWVYEQGQGIYAEDGGVLALEGLIIDITEQKQQEFSLRYLGEHDSLTGFYNRRYLEQVLEQDARTMVGEKRAVVLLSLKKLNSVSLIFGYRYAEKTVRDLAVTLFPLAEENRLLFCVSFERFAFYIRGYRDIEELSAFCAEVSGLLGRTNTLTSVGCGIGILEIGDHGYEVETILRNASVAAERAAGSAPFGVFIFNDAMKAQLTRETAIRDELMRAAQGEIGRGLFVQYQPILDLRTNRIEGFEALARFRSEALGVLNPLEFIPLAEDMQIIGAVGRSILQKVGEFSRSLERLGFGGLLLSVNISPLQLVSEDFLEELIRILEETSFPAHSLGLEITESVFLDNFEMINEKLKKISGLGIRIAIDDFGSGYSSLSRGRELSVNCLKIDKYFIDKLIAPDPDRSLAGDIISMAHRLGCFVVAEGVELESQRAYLDDHGCDFMQGFLFSRPLDPENAVALLKSVNSA